MARRGSTRPPTPPGAPASASLLEPDEPPACRVERPSGRSDVVLICDHANARIPRQLGSLGLGASDLQRHIALDIGAANVAARLSAQLDCTLLEQSYSRLVIDCNRAPGSPQSILSLSEATPIPGNESLSAEAALARARAIFHPYHDRIRAELDARAALKRRTLLVAVHSFTPVFHGHDRPWHAGLLYNRDPRVARLLLEHWSRDRSLRVGDNEPYAMSDATDYSLPMHGERRAIPHVGIEMRQDLLAAETGQRQWAERLAAALVYVLDKLDF